MILQSGRLDKKHRLVYQVIEDTVTVYLIRLKGIILMINLFLLNLFQGSTFPPSSLFHSPCPLVPNRTNTVRFRTTCQ